MIRTAICGIGGRVGRAIGRIALERNHTISAAFENETSPFIGQDAGTLIGHKPIEVIISAPGREALSETDGIIDFSSPAASISIAAMARELHLPLVIGTTGFSAEERSRITEASRDIPLIVSPNMSLGVNLLFKLTGLAAQILGDEFDVEIFEAHHKFKKDAPSGTAKRLVEVIKSAAPSLSQAPEVFDRSGITGERSKNEIGVQVLRGGDIVGEHTVFFIGEGERIELTHRATSRDTFALGAVIALEFLANRPAGLYTMSDVLGI